MTEYIIINEDKSIQETHIHPSPIITSIQSPQPPQPPQPPQQQTGYRSNLTTPDGKPLFNCLLQHNPEPCILKPKLLSHDEIKVIQEFKGNPPSVDEIRTRIQRKTRKGRFSD